MEKPLARRGRRIESLDAARQEASPTPCRDCTTTRAGSLDRTAPGGLLDRCLVARELLLVDDDRPGACPDEEEPTDHHEHDAHPDVGVDATGTVDLALGGPDHTDDQQDDAVDAEQGSDDVADVEEAGTVDLVLTHHSSFSGRPRSRR